MTPTRTVPPSPVENAWRNRLACRVANFALNRIATPNYRDIIAALIRVGVDETYGSGNTRLRRRFSAAGNARRS